ncbi:MAG: tetratricopeptide repeat protein, partial [Polyangiaceae bacterium]
MRQVAVRFSQHGVAHIAVRRLVQHARETGGEQGALDELHALDLVAGSTEVGPLIAFLTAESIENRGDDDAALAAYLRIADRWPYPFGAFWDDSLWRASLLDEKLGRPRAAVDDLERMVRERETTNIVGTYERAKYVPAMLRIGALWQGPLHDPEKAREAYHRLYAQFANSTSRDDALWLEASSWKDEGKSDRACGLLSTLVREFPDSRYVPCAVASCASLARPAKSKAPRECHPYIERKAPEGPEAPGPGPGSDAPRG